MKYLDECYEENSWISEGCNVDNEVMVGGGSSNINIDEGGNIA